MNKPQKMHQTNMPTNNQTRLHSNYHATKAGTIPTYLHDESRQGSLQLVVTVCVLLLQALPRRLLKTVMVPVRVAVELMAVQNEAEVDYA